jgi:hypothetical protein
MFGRTTHSVLQFTSRRLSDILIVRQPIFDRSRHPSALAPNAQGGVRGDSGLAARDWGR